MGQHQNGMNFLPEIHSLTKFLRLDTATFSTRVKHLIRFFKQFQMANLKIYQKCEKQTRQPNHFKNGARNQNL